MTVGSDNIMGDLNIWNIGNFLIVGNQICQVSDFQMLYTERRKEASCDNVCPSKKTKKKKDNLQYMHELTSHFPKMDEDNFRLSGPTLDDTFGRGGSLLTSQFSKISAPKLTQ